MRVGFVVDGESEFRSLPRLFDQLRSSTGAQFERPLLAKIQPLAPVPVIARACESRIAILEQRGVDISVILFDRETRPECCGELAVAVHRLLSKFASCNIAVVVKNRCFENWLVADIDALRAQPGRFRVSRAVVRAVSRNNADQTPAVDLLKRCAKGDYDKVRDSYRILEQAEISRIAMNSRSFRRFLRVVGHPLYTAQSRQPAA